MSLIFLSSEQWFLKSAAINIWSARIFKIKNTNPETQLFIFFSVVAFDALWKLESESLVLHFASSIYLIKRKCKFHCLLTTSKKKAQQALQHNARNHPRLSFSQQVPFEIWSWRKVYKMCLSVGDLTDSVACARDKNWPRPNKSTSYYTLTDTNSYCRGDARRRVALLV